MKFHYKAQNENNEIVEGEAEATDKFELARNLKTEKKTILYAEEKKSRGFGDIELPAFLNRVKYHERIVFLRNLSSMLTAGLSLSRAIGIFEKQAQNPQLKKLFSDLAQSISRGRTFSDSMKEHTAFFSPLAVAMVHAGEESGNLPDTLKTISDLMEKIYQLKRRVRGALMYPIIVMLALFGVGVLLFVYVVPTLTTTFKELNVPLPYSTQIIILISDVLSQHTFLALSSIAGVFAALYFSARTPQGRYFFEALVLKLPVLGVMVREYNSAQTARTLSSLLLAGIQMIEAIRITRDVIQNSHYRTVFEDAEQKIQKGVVLSQVFVKYPDLYPLLVSEMMAVGEETGKLSDMLGKLAVFYEEEVDQKTKDLSTIIEPVIMIVIGVVVGFFAVSMITPLYSLSGSI